MRIWGGRNKFQRGRMNNEWFDKLTTSSEQGSGN